MSTYTAKPASVVRKWYLVDAANQPLGRLASAIAVRLRGKHKPEYTPHVDTGDYIVVINADQIRVTGNKRQDKMYHHHTGYPGGIKSINLEDLLVRSPIEPLKKAVKGMLPKGPLGRDMLGKLKLYAGTEHQHSAQQPELINLLED